MRKALSLGLAFLAGMCCMSCPGQVGARGYMPPDSAGVGTAVPGIFLTPAANAPFSAEVEIVSHEKLPDGTEHVTAARNHMARSSSGRIYQERHAMAAADLLGKTPVLSEHIYDPSSRQSIMIFPFRHLARELTLRAPEVIPASALPPSQQVKNAEVRETDLGTQSLDGVELRGLRKQRTIAAQFSGIGKDVEVTDEYWYSEALSIYMIIRHNDPRTGEQLVAVTKVERTEPPATQFAVPSAYKVVDETTEEAPVAAQ